MNFEFFFVQLALTMMLACIALRINSLRGLQKLAVSPDPKRETEWGAYARRLAEKSNHFN